MGCDSFCLRFRSFACEVPECEEGRCIAARVDVRTAELCFTLGGQVRTPFERLEALAQAIEVRHGHAARSVRARKWTVPSYPEDFQDELEDLHGEIFPACSSDPDAPPGVPSAGRVRRAGEPDVYFGATIAPTMGAPAEKIPEYLLALHRKYICGQFPAGTPRAHAVARLAPLLAQFFRIHPFHDGNGRVGRLLCLALLDQAGHPSYLRIGGVGDEQRYQKALRTADRGALRGSDPGPRQDLGPLREWMADNFLDDRQDEEEEAGPASLPPSGPGGRG